MHRTHAAAVKLLTHALVLPASGVVPQAERSNRNRNQHSNCNQRGVQQCQPDRQLALRKVDHLLGLQSCVPPGRKEGTPPHRQVLAAAAVSDSPLATPVPTVRPRRACATAMAVGSTLRDSHHRKYAANATPITTLTS